MSYKQSHCITMSEAVHVMAPNNGHECTEYFLIHIVKGRKIFRQPVGLQRGTVRHSPE